MTWAVQVLAVLVGGLLMALFVATIWSSVSLLWDAWRESHDERDRDRRDRA
jgi:MFS superfamily sulfate permease-like transporter